jgi:hypothetical protein
MNIRRSLAVSFALSASVGAMFVLGGCEDEADAQRQAAATALQEASVKYAEAGSAEDRAGALASAAQSLAGAGANAGDAAGAAALLEASARRDLAAIRVAEAQSHDSVLRGLRVEMMGMAGASRQANATAGSLEGFDRSTIESAISVTKQQLQAALEQATAAQARLQQPVDQMTAASEADKAKVNQLRDKARQHRENAFELGNGPASHAETLAAVEVDRQADVIEAGMALREAELGGLRSQLAIATVTVDQLRQQIATAEKNSSGLAANEGNFDQGASGLRARSGAMRTAFQAAWQSAKTESEALAAAAGEAITQIDQAVAKCDVAARGPEASSARVLKARLLQLKARALSLQAASAADQVTLVQMLVDSGSALGDAAAFQSALQTATEAQAAMSQQAHGAFTEAAAALDGVSGAAQADVAIFKAELSAAGAKTGSGQ